MAIINLENSCISDYLSNKTYYIPDYQREYSWGQEQLDDLWQDLTSAIQENRDHFYGQAVIHKDKNENKFYIIDGQQRTTSVIILLAALRDEFEKFAPENQLARNKVEDIRVKYIGRYDAESDELKFYLGIGDKLFFRDNIQGGKPSKDTKPKTPSQKRILDAYDFFRNNLSEMIAGDLTVTEKVTILSKCYKTLLQSFKIIVVTTDDVNEAFVIFETLNARGKDLETADLLKNNIFRKAGKNIDVIKSTWASLMDNLDNRDEATKFIRYFWNSRHKQVREKDLYREVSVRITQDNCYDFVSELQNMADVYNAISNPEESKRFSDPEINSCLCNLSTMSCATYYPVVFALVKQDYDEPEIRKVLKAIEGLALRNFIVAGLTGNKYEVFFANLANEISNGQCLIKNALERLRAETIDDERFSLNLKNLVVPKAQVAKYILREIEDYGNPEKKTNTSNKTINLEHIMPKNNKQWKVDEDFHKRNLLRLANQTIMLDEYNKSASNKVFPVKKENYSKSTIEMTRKLVEVEVWNQKAIDDREKELIAVIKKRWALVPVE
ncbi:MAG: DUF262 domain-containing protein [Clostridia bacterium]|nr:DUF262 domain-containing protein [Clostridia bacterium]